MTDHQTDLRRRWRFFLNNAGYATPPGRAACALEYARAELAAEARGWETRWDWDDEPYFGEELHNPETVEYAILIDPDNPRNILASLSGIADADDNYRRVISAELADEALSEITRREGFSYLHAV